MPSLLIVIVTMNAARYMRTCLHSLYTCAPLGYETRIVVVDNCSRDETVRIVQRDFPGVEVLVNQDVAGLSENNNKGLKTHPSDYYLILNPDTELKAGSLDKMLAYMKENPRVGVCAPKLVFPDGTVQESVRRFPTPLAVLARGTFLKQLAWFRRLYERYLMSECNPNQVHDVDWALGACLLIRGETLAQVGFMDEAYRLYYEDIDYCYRVNSGGWKITYIPDAVVVHYYQRESARRLNQKTFWHVRSILRFFWKYRFNTREV